MRHFFSLLNFRLKVECRDICRKQPAIKGRSSKAEFRKLSKRVQQVLKPKLKQAFFIRHSS